MLFLLVLAAIQQAPAEQQPKEILVQLRRSVQQRLPLRMDTQFKQYSDWGGTDVEAGAVFSSDTRLTLTADAFLLELDLGRGYRGVHILRGCELTRFLRGPDRLHYSKWKFAVSECFSWPRYCPADCQLLWDNFAFGGLFSPVVQDSVAVKSEKKEWVLELTTVTPRNLPVYWRYHFDPNTYEIHKTSRRTKDNGNNPVVSEKTGVWTLQYRPLLAEELERVRSWQPPKGAKLRKGKDSSIAAERLEVQGAGQTGFKTRRSAP